MRDSPKWVKSKKRREKKKERKREREKERERLNNGDNNGQATHGARKHAWRTQAAWANVDILRTNLIFIRKATGSMSVSQSVCHRGDKLKHR